MRTRWRDRHRHDPAELNITAFMNLMVILVPFLLITAVFSRMAILELNLPGRSDATPPPEQQALQLEVTVREDRIEIGDRGTGLLKVLPNGPAGPDLNGLAEYLKRVKARFPEKVDATLLLEPDIEYDTLVQVMDTVRVAPAGEETEGVMGELFPEIAIGDAVSRPVTASVDRKR